MWLECNGGWRSKFGKLNRNQITNALLGLAKKLKILILVQQEAIRRLNRWLSLYTTYFSITLGIARGTDKSRARVRVKVLDEAFSIVQMRDVKSL